MKKKILVIGITIFIIGIGVIFLVRKNDNINHNGKVNQYYSQYQQDVDSGIGAFMESDAFKNMEEANQIEEMNHLLKMYENNGIIKDLYYDEQHKLFSFVYNYGEMKEVLGGVSLKTWDPMMN